MSPFRHVPDGLAGPDALGILVPPGRRTVVILRPRSLAWDLLLLDSGRENGTSTAFCELSRDEAALAARKLFHALQVWACGGPGQVKAVLSSTGDGYWVRTEVGGSWLIACLRVPGQPYRPTLFRTLEEATDATARIRAVLCPLADAEQPFYFNTQNFSR